MADVPCRLRVLVIAIGPYLLIHMMGLWWSKTSHSSFRKCFATTCLDSQANRDRCLTENDDVGSRVKVLLVKVRRKVSSLCAMKRLAKVTYLRIAINVLSSVKTRLFQPQISNQVRIFLFMSCCAQCQYWQRSRPP